MLGSKGILPPTDAYELLRCKGSADPPPFRFLADLGEAAVEAVFADEFVVGAFFGDAAVLDDKDLVGVPDRRQAVGDGDDGPAPGELGDGGLDQVLVLRVDAGRGLVQNDDGRVLKDGPGNGNPLFFTAGQGTAALADYRVVTLWQSHDKAVAAGFFCRFDHLLLRGVRLSEADIRPDRVVEKVDILEDHGNIREKTVTGKFLQIMAAHGNAAALGIVEPGQQTTDRGFSGTGGADDGRRGFLGDPEADIFQYLAGIVAKIHIFKLNIVMLQRNIFSIRINETPGLQSVQLIHRILDDAQNMGAVTDGLKARKNTEREKDEHQHNGEIHIPGEAHECRRKGQAHASAFQSQQMKGVAGNIAPLDFQMDIFAVPDGARHGLHGSAAFSKRFHHGEASGVLDHGPCHILIGLGLHRSILAAIMGNYQHKSQGKSRCQKGDEGRQWAENCKADENHEEIQISADEIVDHADPHIFQRGKACRDGA